MVLTRNFTVSSMSLVCGYVPVSDICLAGGLVDFNIIFILAASLFFHFCFRADIFLKAFRPLGEYLSFASPKERYQRKGDPMSLESPLKNADLRRRRNSRAATVSPLKHSPS
jgi:hypothetical protein